MKLFIKTKTQKRQSLRKRIRKYKDKSQRGVLSKRGFFKWKKLENRYRQLGIDIFMAAPFDGLDLTAATIVDEQGVPVAPQGLDWVRSEFYKGMGENSVEWMLKADTQWGQDGPRPVPKGVEIKYRLDDGQVETYENGKVVGQEPMIDHPMWWRQEQRANNK